MNWDSFYQSWHGRLFGYVMRRTGDRELSLDICQESFARCLARYPEQKDARPLLFTIARNLAFDHFRRAGRESPADGASVAARGPDPERALLAREESSRLLRALEKLSGPEREVLSLAVGKNVSYKEIALICGISEQNVKVRVHRARKKLRSFMKEEP